MGLQFSGELVITKEMVVGTCIVHGVSVKENGGREGGEDFGW
jgi:hypothetical protein